MKKSMIIILIGIFMIAMIGSVGSVFSKEVVVNESNYNDYFYDDGVIKDFDGGIKENDTLKLSNLDGKTVVINKKLTVDRENTNSVFSNGHIRILSGSDGSIIKNLKIIGKYDTYGSQGSSTLTKSVIFIEHSEDIILQGLFLNITNGLGTIGTLNCISINGDSLDIQILNSKFYLNALSESVYCYGVAINSNVASNTIISGNLFNMRSKNYVAGITSSSRNTTIEKNAIYLYSNLMYGIYISGSNAIATKILNNNITANGEIYYLIESWQGSDTTISNNILTGNGKGGFAYAAMNSKNDLITGNNITLKGTNVNNISFRNGDSLKGHGGIYYANSLGNNTISNNRIISEYKNGGDYAIKSNSTDSTFFISNNYLISDMGRKLGNTAIDDYLTGNHLNNGPEIATIQLISISGTQVVGGTVKFRAILKDKNGNLLRSVLVNLFINDVFVKSQRTDSKGEILIEYKFPNKGNYNYYLITEYGNLFAKTTLSNINIKDKTVLTVSAPSIVKNEKTIISTTLKNSKGQGIANQKITLTINKKTYALTTNSKGIAIFKISGLREGSFKFNVKYAGSNSYLTSSSTKTQVVKKVADLKITKVRRSGNNYKITIKNYGKATSAKARLKLSYSKKKYNLVTVKSIKPGKSLTVLVKFFKYNTHKKYKKTAQINYNKAIKESNYNNNIKTFKA